MRSFADATRLAGAVALLAAVTASGIRAQTSSAADAYERTLAREQTARAESPVSLDGLREIAQAYERLVARYPNSGYADNALWQAAGLYSLSYAKSGEPADKRETGRFLNWLRREYPKSSLVKQIDAALAALSSASPAPQITPVSMGAPAVPAASSTPATVSTAKAGAAPRNAAPPAVLTSITTSAIPRGDRITLEFSKEVAYTGDRVDHPDRVFMDFANAAAPSTALDQAQKIAGGFVKALRIGRFSPTVMRVVLDLSASPRYSAFVLYDPFRLVIDVESTAPIPAPLPMANAASSVPLRGAITSLPPPPPVPPVRVEPEPKIAPLPAATVSPSFQTPSAAAPNAAPGAMPSNATPGGGPAVPRPPGSSRAVPDRPLPPASNSNGDYSLARQLGLGVSRIVIDAGHGGHDPGAQSNGINESELVLDVALRLQTLLMDLPGFQVVLTRATDDFLPLEERTAIANRESADLFLSIHANASPQAATRGIETYFLNFASNPAAEAVAARENATGGQSMHRMDPLLKAIALNSKLAESRDLATLVQSSLQRRLAVQNKNLKDLGVKQAPFVVLIGAGMPSVLAEISFLTNKNEAALLKLPAYRQRIAQGLCDAIVNYQNSLKKGATVATKDGRR